MLVVNYTANCLVIGVKNDKIIQIYVNLPFLYLYFYTRIYQNISYQIMKYGYILIFFLNKKTKIIKDDIVRKQNKKQKNKLYIMPKTRITFWLSL